MGGCERSDRRRHSQFARAGSIERSGGSAHRVETVAFEASQDGARPLPLFESGTRLSAQGLRSCSRRAEGSHEGGGIIVVSSECPCRRGPSSRLAPLEGELTDGVIFIAVVGVLDGVEPHDFSRSQRDATEPAIGIEARS